MYYSRILRFISIIVLFFFSWTFGGLFDIAYAVKSSDQQSAASGQQTPKEKRTEEKLTDALVDIEKVLTDVSTDVAIKKDKLKAKKTEIESLDSELKKQFSDTEKKLKDSGISPEILKRHSDFVKKYEDNLNELKNNIDAIDKAKTEAEADIEIEKTKAHLKKLKPPKIHKPLDPNKLPHRTSEPVFKEPRTAPEQFTNNQLAYSIHEDSSQRSAVSIQHITPLNPPLVRGEVKRAYDPILVASAGSLSGLLSKDSDHLYSPSPLAGERWGEGDQFTPDLPSFRSDRTELSDYLLLAQASNPPTSADLAETIEVQFTPAITAKAAELGNDPVKIYNWVRNNIEFVPTYGSIQGADYCLQTKLCNAFDTASLLIALLRVSGIHAKYAEGTVEIPIEKVKNWLGGFTDSFEALSLLSSAGIPTTGMTVGGEMRYARMEHVWVEAWIDYFPSRGARHKAGQGELWIPLDASFKQYTYTQGIDIQSAVPFDAQSFIDQIQATATINEAEGYVTGVDSQFIDQTMTDYQTQVESHITQNYPDATVGDVLGTKEIVPHSFTYLLGTLPYRTIVRGIDYSEIPDSLRHKIRFSVVKDLIDELSGTPIDITKSLPELAGKKLTLSYTPATPADEQIIESYEGIYDTPVYIVNMKPQLKQEGIVIATGSDIGLGNQEKFEMVFSGPNLSPDIVSNDVTAGSYNGIIINSNKISDDLLEERRIKVNNAYGTVDNSNIYTDEYIGELLYVTGLIYFFELNMYENIASKRNDVISISNISENIVTKDLKISYLFDIPFNAEEGGMIIDVDRHIFSSSSKSGDKSKSLEFMFASGYLGSSMEHGIFEQMYNEKGTSAVMALSKANELGVPVFTINKTNINLIMPNLQLDNNTITDIQNAVNAGRVVTVSETTVNVNTWTGVGYIILDPNTGAAAYMISGGYSGGQSNVLLSKFKEYIPCILAILDFSALFIGGSLFLLATVELLFLAFVTPVGIFAATLLALQITFIMIFMILVIASIGLYLDRFENDYSECMSQ